MKAAQVREELLAEIPERYETALAVRRLQNARALLRRKQTTPKLRERLEYLVPILQQELEERGISLDDVGWRPYPDAKGGLKFGLELSGKDLDFEFVEPPRRKRDRKKLETPKAPQDELMALLEASLAQQMKK